MKIIGLCGGSGSGKGAASRIFADLGLKIIDTDAIYHEITSGKSPCLSALTEAFGEKILNKNGSLNRKALSEIVFKGEGSEKRHRLLNEISHFHVLEEVKRLIEIYRSNGARGVIIDAPMLFESGFDASCDAVVAVIADENTRIKRITERDGITPEDAKLRITKQLDNEFLAAYSDYIIVNDGSIEELAVQARNTADKILIS